jgi:tetratricopeptide (TPR) repeat protein
MKSLKEITQIITRLKTTKLEVIDDIPDMDSKDHLSRLFAGIKNGTIGSDQQAAQVIYGSTYIDSKYTTLKNRLRTKLLNTLFFLDIKPPEHSVSAEGFYKTFKYTFWVRTLLILGARQTAIKLAEKALALAIRFSLTNEAVQLLADLRYQTSITASKTEYEKYDVQLKQELINLNGEILAKEYYERIVLEFAKSTEERPDLTAVMLGYITSLDSLNPKPQSYEFYKWAFMVKIFALQIRQEYEEAIIACNEAEKFHLQFEHLASNIRLGEVVVQKLACHLQLRQFDKGAETARRCSELFREGINSWFSYMNTYFLLAMNTQHFQEANTIYNQVTSNDRFNFQLEATRELWRIYGAFLEFALQTTYLKERGKEGYSFDIAKFLRDVPSYKKDKRGHNVSILVLHILILLQQNDFDSIISRMDALKTYRTRYLQVSSNKQSAIFFKMLMIMENCSFGYKETSKKAQKYYDKLLEVSSDADEMQEGLQILPFDWLWKQVLEMLKSKEAAGII